MHWEKYGGYILEIYRHGENNGKVLEMIYVFRVVFGAKSRMYAKQGHVVKWLCFVLREMRDIGVIFRTQNISLPRNEY